VNPLRDPPPRPLTIQTLHFIRLLGADQRSLPPPVAKIQVLSHKSYPPETVEAILPFLSRSVNKINPLCGQGKCHPYESE